MGNEPHQPVIQTATAGEFVVTMWASDGCPDTGAMVTLRATLTNDSSQTQVVNLNDQPVLDIIIGNPDRSTVRWSTGKALTPDLTRLELKPTESKTIEMQWKMQWEGQNRPFIHARFIDDERFINHPRYASIWTGENCGMGGIR